MTSSSSHHHDASSATSTPRAGPGSSCSSNGNGNGNGGGGNYHHPPPPRAQALPHGAACVRLMCSFGGRILPRPGDHQLRYVGGETRIVSVPRTTSHAVLFAALAKLAPMLFVPGEPNPALRYQLPHDDLDALISVSSDDDVDNLMEELDRVQSLAATATAIKPPRLRLFLFAPSPDHSSAGAFGSVLSGVGDASSDQWFVDQLNVPPPGSIERGRSEASSIVSEVPDYLFGFDTTSEEPSPGADAQPKSDAEMAQVDDDAPAPVLGAPLAPYIAESAPWPAPPPPYMAQPVYYVPVRPVHYLDAAGHGGYMPGPVYHIVGGGRNEAPGDLYASGSVGGVYGVPRSMPPFRQVMYAPPPATEVYSVEGKPPEGESHFP